MTSISTPHSATIYQFPVGGRSGLATSRGERYGANQPTPPAATYAMIDAWYHQDAICESLQATKQ